MLWQHKTGHIALGRELRRTIDLCRISILHRVPIRPVAGRCASRDGRLQLQFAQGTLDESCQSLVLRLHPLIGDAGIGSAGLGVFVHRVFETLIAAGVA